MTIRPPYDEPRPLAYINKVIQQYHRLPHITLTRDEGYHTLTYDDGVVVEERTIMIPYTSHDTLGSWVREAIGFHQEVRAKIREAHAAEAEELRRLVAAGNAILDERKAALKARDDERGVRIQAAYMEYDRTEREIMAEEYRDAQDEQHYRAIALQQLHLWETRLEEITR